MSIKKKDGDKLTFNRKLYMSWYNAKLRCYDKTGSKYKSYGARGIRLCDEWLNNFQAFHDWAINNGYRDGLTLERIDVDGNYEPDNCKWITIKEQAYNKQDTISISFNNNSYPLATWNHILALGKNTCHVRHKLGWQTEKLLTKRGDEKYLYPHQVDILGKLYKYNRSAMFLDMGL